MHHITTTLFLAGTALAISFGVHAQSPPGVDMSRYESIHETPKPSRGKTVPKSVLKGIQPGKNVETIGPSVGYANPRFSGPGVSEIRQPVLRGGISMKADGSASGARAPAPAGGHSGSR